MAEKTGIAWCDSTFNPWLGCTKISPACDNCYAERMSGRFGVEWGAVKPRKRTSISNWKLPLKWNKEPFYECSECHHRFDGKALNPGSNGGSFANVCPSCESTRFQQVRRRVFCGSLCDVFDNEVPAEWRADLFRLIEKTPNLDWLLLTKRIGNIKRWLESDWISGVSTDLTGRWVKGFAPQNVWLGITARNQEEADRDIPKLLSIPAVKLFLSIEPMLGPIDLRHLFQHCPVHDYAGGFCINDCGNWQRLSWVICGGETGKNARPMHPAWVRSLRDQCQAACVPFFFKAWGEFYHPGPGTNPDLMVRVGRKRSGSRLDGRVWEEIPA